MSGAGGSGLSDESARIAEGRVKHGVGASENFPGDVCHLVSPIVGYLRLRERDGEPVQDLEWLIDRLGLVLAMARHEAQSATRPGEPEIGCGGCGEPLDPERGLYAGSAAYCEPCSEQVYGDHTRPGKPSPTPDAAA